MKIFLEDNEKEWQEHFNVVEYTLGFFKFLRYVSETLDKFAHSLDQYAFDFAFNEKDSSPMPLKYFFPDVAEVTMIVKYLLEECLNQDDARIEIFHQLSEIQLEVSKEKLQDWQDLRKGLGDKDR